MFRTSAKVSLTLAVDSHIHRLEPLDLSIQREQPLVLNMRPVLLSTPKAMPRKYLGIGQCQENIWALGNAKKIFGIAWRSPMEDNPAHSRRTVGCPDLRTWKSDRLG
jgi:hypothetical protein